MKLNLFLITILCYFTQGFTHFSNAQLYTPGGIANVQTSASGFLEFKHNTSNGGIRIIRNSSSTLKSKIAFFQNTTEKWSIGVDKDQNNGNDFWIWGNGATRLFIAGNGKIGINTEAPNHLLHVVGGGVYIKETNDATLDNDGPGADLVLEDKLGGILNIFSSSQEGGINLGGGATRLSICKHDNQGTVVIGDVPIPTTNNYKLYVGKGILTEKLKIAFSSDAVNWSDFVFDKNYKLLPLDEVEAYIQKNHHLPEIPSAEEIYKEGLNVAQMDAKLLQKIEELTLYMIEMEKKNKDLQKRIIKLEKRFYSK